MVPQRHVIEPLERRLLLATFGVIGDYSSGPGLLDVSNLIKSWNPDYIFTVGDNSYADDPTIDDTAGQYFHEYISPYTGAYGAGATSGNRFFPSLGNHDWDNSAGASEYLNFFTLPGNERYYTLVTDNIEWFVIDSDAREPDGVTATSTQANWLRDRLAESTATFKIVVCHHPPFSSGDHGNNPALQWPFKEWGATAALAGHDHNYERIIRNDFPYFVNGLGGESIRGFPVIVGGSQLRYNADFGAMRIDSSASEMNFRFYSRSGQLIDQYVLPAPGLTSTIVPGGSSWKYLANGSDQGTAWPEPGFPETGWSTGNAQLGYGEGDEATVVPFGPNANNKWVTTYFRKTFAVADPSIYEALGLQLLRDDGAVVYLNGNEIFRSNMPAGAIAFNTFASSAIGFADETTFVYATIDPAMLASGNNVLAVEMHQNIGNSSDLSFDLRLAGTLAEIATPPAAPTNLSAAHAGGTQVNLTWQDNATTESGFIIERATNAGPFTHLASVGANVVSYADANALAGNSYAYRLRAHNPLGPSGYSNAASVIISGTLLVNSGSTWKYYDNGTNQGTAWRATTYDDSHWKNGVAEFGYGEGDEATVVRFGRGASHKYITTYFRKAFYVGNPGSVTSLNVELLRDDGAVVYLNGVEAWRSNMPAGTISHTTLAASAVALADETTFFTQSVSPSLLHFGMNVIAVEIHQSSANSSDVSFDLRLRAATSPPTSGPAAVSALRATAVAPTQINLSWVDTATSETGFSIRRSTDGVMFSEIATLATNQSGYTDTTVSPATTYWYRVYTFNGAGTSPSSSVATATTPAMEMSWDTSLLRAEPREFAFDELIRPYDALL